MGYVCGVSFPSGLPVGDPEHRIDPYHRPIDSRSRSRYDGVDILHYPYPSRGSHMFARWSVHAGLACSLACYPLALQGQDQSLQQRIADDFIALAGGVHPGYRIAHAKGIIVTGTFAPSRGATSLSRAPHLVAASTPVIARYSNGSGVQTLPTTAPTRCHAASPFASSCRTAPTRTSWRTRTTGSSSAPARTSPHSSTRCSRPSPTVSIRRRSRPFSARIRPL